MQRNQSLATANVAGDGKSVAVRAVTEKQDATTRIGLQASLVDCERAVLAVAASVSGQIGSWWVVDTFEVTPENDRTVMITDVPAAYIRASLIEDIPSPRPVAPPEPVETIEAQEHGDGSSTITTTLATPAPKPVAPWGVSCWLSAV